VCTTSSAHLPGSHESPMALPWSCGNFMTGRKQFPNLAASTNMTAAGKTTWFEFAKVILEEASRMPRGIPWFEAASKGRPLVTRRVTAIPAESTPRRPVGLLFCALELPLKQDFGLELPAWSCNCVRWFAECQTTADLSRRSPAGCGFQVNFLFVIFKSSYCPLGGRNASWESGHSI